MGYCTKTGTNILQQSVCPAHVCCNLHQKCKDINEKVELGEMVDGGRHMLNDYQLLKNTGNYYTVLI